MFTNRFATITATFVVAITGTVNADGEDTPAQAVPVEVFPLPANTVFERHVVGETGNVAAVGERLVYSNTLGTFAGALGAGRLVSDDIATIAPNGCKLRRYEFPVVGKVNPAGVGGPYTVDFALYSNCPGSVPSGSRQGLIIPGTQGQVTFIDQCQNNTDNDGDTVVNDGCPAVGPAETGAECENAIDDDGDGKVNDGCPAVGDPETDVDGVPRLISFVPTIDAPLPTNFWFGVKFSRNNAGVILGAPAMTGFSADGMDWPGFGCNSDFGGFPDQPHASFNAEIFVDADCADAFVGYKNSKPSGSLFNPGADIFLADDIQLGVNECQMIAYEVAVRGIGLYTFHMQDNCESGLIAGTEKTFPLIGTSNVSIARFAFDPPILLPQNLWFQTKVNNPTGSVIIAGQQADIGATGELVYTVVGNTCPEVPPSVLGLGIHGAVNLTIICAGTPPVGACCDMIFTDENGDSVCREAPQMNCPWPWPQYTSSDQPQWVEAVSCDPDPFPFPCGAAACCRPDQVCENLTQNECSAVPPLDGPRQWRRGRYCGVDGQVCPWVACLSRTGDCHTAHEEPGCQYGDCCAAVCDADSYCCLVEWDRVCVELANDLCSLCEHDECTSPNPIVAAQSVEADSVTVFSKVGATENLLDPRFCCRNDAPDVPGLGTVWFKFTATDTSARVSTCNSDPANDSLLQVFAAADPSSEETACASLIPIACSDDVEECGGGTHGRICVKDLVPGRTYYVMVASKTAELQGVYQLEIRSPCFEEPIWIPNDCNENKLPDGCELGRETATDCNVNHILDECDIADGTSFDCDANAFPDECTDPVKTFRPPSPAINGGFGHSVDMQGEWLVVGTSDVYVEPTGGDSLHIYRRIPAGWRHAAEFPLPDAPAYVDLDGNWIVTGSDHDSVAHLFRLDGEEWVEAGTLQGPVVLACPRYGFPVAVHGDTIALGKGFCQFGMVAPPEEVYIFRFDGAQWIEEARISAPDPSGPGGFGASVSLDGDRLLVGAPYREAAFIFRRVGETWGHEATLTPGDVQQDNFFGRSSVLKGEWAFGGATVADSTGAVYVFRQNGILWSQSAKLIASDAVSDQRFGWSVRAAQNTLVVGATTFGGQGEGFPGSAYVFARQGSSWIEAAKLVPPDGIANDSFGHGVAVNESFVAVGAPATLWQDVTNAGAAYVFQLPPRNCNENDAPDLCDVRDGTSPDCNGDHVPDECTLADGTTPDCNHSGVPDDCESLPPFDYDFDGGVDMIDLAGFQRCFTGPGPTNLAPCCTVFDSEPDGDVDLTDFVAFGGEFSGP